MLAFGGTRTFHRLAVAVEDAGFEIRDSIAWLYGSGFPKSLDVSKAIDKAAGAERRETSRVKGAGIGGGSTFTDDNWKGIGAESFAKHDTPATPDAERWQGWGTALKPAYEPVVCARKPLGAKTVAANVLAHGTGALNIDATRVSTGGEVTARPPLSTNKHEGYQRPWNDDAAARAGVEARREDQHDKRDLIGRWPANVILDESQAAALDLQSGVSKSSGVINRWDDGAKPFGGGAGHEYTSVRGVADKGGASRFFYVAKANKKERPVVSGVAHPTVKPLALMQYLVRLVTPLGGVVLEPFAGSGATVEAAILEGFDVIAVEREESYLPLVVERVKRAKGLMVEE
jgi:site-specific DNA-methyltransferase (adenine-specific)